MAKPLMAPDAPRTRVKTFRVVPHVGPNGKPVPERWDVEEVVVSGVVESRKLHERSVTLPVARHRHSIEVANWMSREAPESWD
jgi:hypothetical protein